MKIVFLDIDGVLNSFQLFLPNENEYSGINPKLILLLNILIEKTNAKIVISSSWRRHHSLDSLEKILKHAGFIGSIIDKTPFPYFSDKMNYNHYGYTCRSDEIQKWLSMEHSEKIDSFVILDDISNMNQLTPFLVCAKNSDGLTKENIEEAIKILER